MMACRNGRLSCMELLFNRHASDTIDTNVCSGFTAMTGKVFILMFVFLYVFQDGKTAYDYCKDRKTLDHMHSVVSAAASVIISIIMLLY